MRRVLIALFAVAVFHAVQAQPEGPVTIGGVTYERVDPGEPFMPAPAPTQDWSAPRPSKAEAVAGMIAFVAPDPGDYRPDRIPKPAEQAASLRAFLTPGEDEPVCFGIHALTALQGLSITVDAKGAPVTIDVRQEHCWPQRTGWKSRRWYTTPELLLPCGNGKKTVPYQRGVLQEARFDVATGQTQGFWLALSAAAGAKAGRYPATVSIQAAGRAALVLPLEIEVLPFVLQQPSDRSWLLYCDAGRWRSMSDEQVLSELRDFARHGMNGLIEMPFGKPDLAQLQQGKVTFDAAAYRRYASLCQQAGMPGPHVIGSPGPKAVMDALGLQTDLNRGTWPAEVKAGVEAVARAALAATRDIPARWYYYGVDEPTGENTYAIQDYQAWHDAGAPTYATFYVPSFLEKASAYLTAPCFVVGLVSREKQAQEARDACARTGAEFFWYGTGSYVNPFPQECFMFHNRYGAGLLFWKTGARVEATWTFCRPHEDVFNDFDGSRANSAEPKEQATAYPHLLKPDDYSTYQGAIPTIAWESLREGVDDYRYLYTLTRLIEQAAASPNAAVVKAGKDAQAELDALVASVPWANPMARAGFETTRLQQVRRLVADRTVALQAALQGGGSRAALPKVRRATVRVRTAAAERSASLPCLTAARAARPPAIDGSLEDPCWRAAASTGAFVDIRDGSAAPLQTRARVTADDQALYVAFECPEPALDAVSTQETKHDGTVWLEDGVEVFIAGAARKPYAHLIVTTANVRLDEANQDSQAWEPQVQTAIGKGAAAWTAEIAVPWAELAKAGVQRAATLTLNLGRSRTTQNDPQTHTAWSATYGGFHEPERFGLLFLPDGDLSLRDVALPGQWGAQEVALGVHNTGEKAAEVVVGLDGGATVAVTVPAAGTRRVSLPVRLVTPGPQVLKLSWGRKGGPMAQTELPVTVPEPVAMKGSGDLVAPDSTTEWPVTVNLALRAQAAHRLLVRLQEGEHAEDFRLSARPGRSVRVPLRSGAIARLQVLLVTRGGATVWESPPQSFMVLPD